MNYRVIVQVLKDGIRGLKMMFFASRRDRYGYIHPTAIVYSPITGVKQNVFLYENTVIHEGARFVTTAGKFTMKRNSTASFNLTVITFLHQMKESDMPNINEGNYANLLANDVTVDEGVLIGANVTICPGSHISRGTVVGAGSVVTRSTICLPYSVIAGNPARFIKFRMPLDEQIRHEEHFYSEKDRLPIAILKENYDTYNLYK